MRFGMPSLAIALSCAGAAHAAPPVDYRFAFEPDASALAARVCTPEAAPQRRFVAGDADAKRYLSAPRRSSGAAVEQRDGALLADGWRAGECLEYRVDLAAIAARRDLEGGVKVGDDLVAAASLFMWRPRGLERAGAAEVSFEIPKGWSLSVPWAPLDDPPHRRFRVGGTAPSWPTMIAIGHFAEEAAVAGRGRVRTAILGEVDPVAYDKLHAFVLASANDVAGSLPRAFEVAPQLLVVPVPSQRASPFGMSLRGGGQGVVLLVNPAAEPAKLDRSWTLTHELVHVVHPYLGPEGRWISEGIATYYQNVLRARNGRISAQDAWDELDAGFARGRADHSDLSLAATSAEMDESGHYMRGYWSGAALMLRADVALRTRKANPSSLDAALNAYLACCRAGPRGLEVDEFLAALDRAVGGDTFGALYRELAHSAEFPDLAAAYERLGISPAKDHVKRSEDPNRVALRTAIMSAD